jgi:hypothetical protein
LPSAAAAVVLTNRYDGIDLPDDDCRLVVLDGLPTGADLQEKFLPATAVMAAPSPIEYLPAQSCRARNRGSLQQDRHLSCFTPAGARLSAPA